MLCSRVVKKLGTSAMPILSMTGTAPGVFTALSRVSNDVLIKETQRHKPRMHGKDDQVRILLMSSADQKVGGCLGGTIDTNREWNLSGSCNGASHGRHIHEDGLLCFVKQRQGCLEKSNGSCGIDIKMFQQELRRDLRNLRFGGDILVSCVCDDDVEVCHSLVFERGHGGETVSVGAAFDLDDDEVGARSSGDVMKGFGFFAGRVADSGDSGGVRATEVFF